MCVCVCVCVSSCCVKKLLGRQRWRHHTHITRTHRTHTLVGNSLSSILFHSSQPPSCLLFVCVCRCKGASHYGLSADRKRRSQEGECTDSTSELTLATLANDGPASAVALLSDEPGLVNPAFDPNMEDNSQSGSTTSLTARNSTKKSECVSV